MHDGSPKLSLSLTLQMPSSGRGVKRKPNVEDQVRAAIQRIDDGTGTEVDFLMLRKVKTALLTKDKKNPRVKSLLEMIEPTLRKFGYYF